MDWDAHNECVYEWELFEEEEETEDEWADWDAFREEVLGWELYPEAEPEEELEEEYDVEWGPPAEICGNEDEIAEPTTQPKTNKAEILDLPELITTPDVPPKSNTAPEQIKPETNEGGRESPIFRRGSSSSKPEEAVYRKRLSRSRLTMEEGFQIQAKKDTEKEREDPLSPEELTQIRQSEDSQQNFIVIKEKAVPMAQERTKKKTTMYG